MGDYQGRIESIPAIESEWNELTRDNLTLQENYKTLLGRSEESKISANLERRQIGEQFRMLDPPRIAADAAGARRIQVNAGGIVLGLVLGLANLDMMQLTKFAEAYTYQLSGGMKQRVSLARALVMDPEILLMDEPFAALDSQTRDLLLVELQLIWAKTRKTILFVTHNISESVCLGDRVIVFTNRPGRVKKEIQIGYRRPRLTEDSNLYKYQRLVLDELKTEIITSRKTEEM